tara:strand:+ start:70 stop:348 length:279 start_codon:yes stop_codon:yes gene_type:complete
MNLVKALNSFSGWKGAEMPTDPTNEAEYLALKNAVDGGSCWEGEAPSWAEVSAKVKELDDADKQAADDKASGNQKLLDLGLSQAEVDALIKG